MAPRTTDYANALDELETLHRDGKVTDSVYEIQRATLIAEAASPTTSVTRIVLTVLAVLVAAGLVVTVVGVLVASLGS